MARLGLEFAAWPWGQPRKVSVSGGTVAFIAGIYEELLTTIEGWVSMLRGLFREGPVAAWRRYNLARRSRRRYGGVVLLLAGLLTTWKPAVLLWVFFGLVAASIPLMLRAIAPEDCRRLGNGHAGPRGVHRLVGHRTSSAVQGRPALPVLFWGHRHLRHGLPGISGSFILVPRLIRPHRAMAAGLRVALAGAGHGLLATKARMGVPGTAPWPSPC